MGRILEFQTLLDFSPSYSYSGLKSNALMQLIIRWINPTAKDNLIFTQPVKGTAKDSLLSQTLFSQHIITQDNILCLRFGGAGSWL